MNSQAKFRVGIDIGGTAVKAVRLSDDGETLERLEFPSRTSDTPAEVFMHVLNTGLQPFFKEGQCTFLGIGCAGSIDSEKGIVRSSPNFALWKDVPLANWVSKIFSVPTAIDNDANCAVLADWKQGAAKGARHVVLLTLGTGVGGGIVVNGQLLRGATGTAAELGHICIDAKGIPCPCGSIGCLERYCSASALKRICPELSAKEIFARASSGEDHFVKIRSEFLHYLSMGLVSVTNTFDPDYIVLGGAISASIVPHIPELKENLTKHAFSAPAKHVQIVGAKFGNWSGAIGATSLLMD